MKKFLNLWVLAFFIVSCTTANKGSKDDKKGWISLFDGSTLNGWRAAENPSTFSVENGSIVVHGPRAHLFYEGPVQNHEFKNFIFKAQVMTTPGSNSGMFIHTAYQENGWPSKGYEIQVNNSHTDWRRTGSLYAVQDVKEQIVKDNEWYTEQIEVQGKRITIKINDRTVVDYTEPDSVAVKNAGGKMLSSGTVALQGHDPDSKVYFKDVMIKPLP
ncbi:3-keto-disaccharide hydrolase [Adhaeribacter radiodurans]|uniref:DUF1080 domain-containing protein n=1 Tax=Adhaeribacter radiodurans TaxID=2745197 RepID=A0A7L7LBK5_9BACT|nr:DUF1080 domain-containing protein [Adhaeribacter radiodurans]QMU29925.1 DUF1080 domain-containing protein [Adhaeribacter radiodurans]